MIAKPPKQWQDPNKGCKSITDWAEEGPMSSSLVKRPRCAMGYGGGRQAHKVRHRLPAQRLGASGLLDCAGGEPRHDAALEDQYQQNKRDRDCNGPGRLSAVIGRELGREVGDDHRRRL